MKYTVDVYIPYLYYGFLTQRIRVIDTHKLLDCVELPYALDLYNLQVALITFEYTYTLQVYCYKDRV